MAKDNAGSIAKFRRGDWIKVGDSKGKVLEGPYDQMDGLKKKPAYTVDFKGSVKIAFEDEMKSAVAKRFTPQTVILERGDLSEHALSLGIWEALTIDSGLSSHTEQVRIVVVRREA